MIPLMPSPGRPKMVSTPQSTSRSISASDAIFDMGASLSFRSVGWHSRGGYPGIGAASILCHGAHRRRIACFCLGPHGNGWPRDQPTRNRREPMNTRRVVTASPMARIAARAARLRPPGRRASRRPGRSRRGARVDVLSHAGRTRPSSPACWVRRVLSGRSRRVARCTAATTRTAPSSGASAGSPTTESSSAARPWPIRASPDRAVILRRVTALDGAAAVSVRPCRSRGDYGRRPGGSRGSPTGRAWVTPSRRHPRPVDRRARRRAGRERRRPGRRASNVGFSPGDTHDFVLELQRTPFERRDRADADELWRRHRGGLERAVPSCSADPRRSRRPPVLRRPARTDRCSMAPRWPPPRPPCPNGPKPVATTTIATPGSATPATSVMPALRSRAARPSSTTRCAGSAPVSSQTVSRPRPAYRGDGAPVPDPESLGSARLPRRIRRRSAIRSASQFQLDLFGEVLLLLANAASRDRLDADGWRRRRIGPAGHRAAHDEKESGIWEIGPDHWTHSRLICVAGLRAIAEHAAPERGARTALSLADRLLSEADRTSLHPSGRWQRSPGRRSGRRVAPAGRNPRRPGRRRSPFGGHPPGGHRRTVRGRLPVPLRRSRASPSGEDEGAFLICNFWMALAHLGAGETTTGAQWFERARASCSSSGLFSEEYDVAQRQLRGQPPAGLRARPPHRDCGGSSGVPDPAVPVVASVSTRTFTRADRPARGRRHAGVGVDHRGDGRGHVPAASTGLGWTYASRACADRSLRITLADAVIGSDVLGTSRPAMSTWCGPVGTMGRPGVGQLCHLRRRHRVVGLQGPAAGHQPGRPLRALHRRRCAIYGSGGFTTYDDATARAQLEQWVGDWGIPRASRSRSASRGGARARARSGPVRVRPAGHR